MEYESKVKKVQIQTRGQTDTSYALDALDASSVSLKAMGINPKSRLTKQNQANDAFVMQISDPYIMKSQWLRWVPKEKTFASSTTKVESEPPNGSNADITNQCESKQALKVSTELGIQDHNNEPSSSKLVPKVVPLAVKTATSRQELELLFHHQIAMLRTT
ncbi:hypothetical protein Tco_0782016, partial [Tanacetum coccineum]